jgi:predicted dehydrogenase
MYILLPTECLKKKHFDIVHILTPPMSHFDLAMKALESGTHVFLEKPITLQKVKRINYLTWQTKRGLLLCSGPSLLFMQCYIKAINWIRQGKFGDVLSAYCFFGHSEKKKTVSYGGVSHWAYAMPGGPLLNLLSHPASVIVDLIGMPQHIQCMASARNLMPYNMKVLYVCRQKTEISSV